MDIEAAEPDFKVKLIVASATGLRAGEFHALRWRHLDLDKGELAVETVSWKDCEEFCRKTFGAAVRSRETILVITGDHSRLVRYNERMCRTA